MRVALAFVMLACVIVVVSTFATFAAGNENISNHNIVELELVLAIDTSTSVDAQEFALQKNGLALAFLHKQVVDAILSNGKLGVAVSVVQWAGARRQATVVDWSILRSELDAQLFSAKIFATTRMFTGQTDIGGAIIHSVASLETNAITGLRRTIDISGDGSGDDARSAQGRDMALARNITINGLVIDNEDIDLGILAKLDIHRHYNDFVIGGAGSFLMIAKDFDDYAVAIRRKLVREIRGLNLVKY